MFDCVMKKTSGKGKSAKVGKIIYRGSRGMLVRWFGQSDPEPILLKRRVTKQGLKVDYGNLRVMHRPYEEVIQELRQARQVRQAQA